MRKEDIREGGGREVVPPRRLIDKMKIAYRYQHRVYLSSAKGLQNSRQLLPRSRNDDRPPELAPTGDRFAITGDVPDRRSRPRDHTRHARRSPPRAPGAMT
jgi:hypothetical protein